jgi:riboflavin synthase
VFTGLVDDVGTIERIAPIAAGREFRIRCRDDDLTEGESIALNGACMTATVVEGARFGCDVSAESLTCTTGLDRPGDVNIETSLRLGDALGGHLVAGHVDGVGSVRTMQAVGESWELVIVAPRQLARFLAVKGSLSVNGVSLTVNRVTDTADGCEVSVNIIPHTHSVTTLGQLAPGNGVNLEIDLIARYVERMLPHKV